METKVVIKQTKEKKTLDMSKARANTIFKLDHYILKVEGALTSKRRKKIGLGRYDTIGQTLICNVIGGM